MAMVKKLTNLAGIGVVLGYLLAWIAFPPKQAVILSAWIFSIIGFGIGYVLDYHKTLDAAPRQQSFLPYYVLVQPNWPNLLLDFKLIKDAEEFRELYKKSRKTRPSVSRLYAHGSTLSGLD